LLQPVNDFEPAARAPVLLGFRAPAARNPYTLCLVPCHCHGDLAPSRRSARRPPACAGGRRRAPSPCATGEPCPRPRSGRPRPRQTAAL